MPAALVDRIVNRWLFGTSWPPSYEDRCIWAAVRKEAGPDAETWGGYRVELRGRGGRRREVIQHLAALGYRKPRGRPRKFQAPEDGWVDRWLALLLMDAAGHWWETAMNPIPEGCLAEVQQLPPGFKKLRDSARACRRASELARLPGAVYDALGSLLGVSPRAVRRDFDLDAIWDQVEAKRAIIEAGIA